MTNEKVICPICGEEVKPVPFGFGFVWICCEQVIKSVDEECPK